MGSSGAKTGLVPGEVVILENSPHDEYLKNAGIDEAMMSVDWAAMWSYVQSACARVSTYFRGAASLLRCIGGNERHPDDDRMLSLALEGQSPPNFAKLFFEKWPLAVVTLLAAATVAATPSTFRGLAPAMLLPHTGSTLRRFRMLNRVFLFHKAQVLFYQRVQKALITVTELGLVHFGYRLGLSRPNARIDSRLCPDLRLTLYVTLSEVQASLEGLPSPLALGESDSVPVNMDVLREAKKAYLISLAELVENQRRLITSRLPFITAITQKCSDDLERRHDLTMEIGRALTRTHPPMHMPSPMRIHNLPCSVQHSLDSSEEVRRIGRCKSLDLQVRQIAARLRLIACPDIYKSELSGWEKVEWELMEAVELVRAFRDEISETSDADSGSIRDEDVGDPGSLVAAAVQPKESLDGDRAEEVWEGITESSASTVGYAKSSTRREISPRTVTRRKSERARSSRRSDASSTQVLLCELRDVLSRRQAVDAVP